MYLTDIGLKHHQIHPNVLKQLQDKLNVIIVFWIVPNDIEHVKLNLLGLVMISYILHLLKTQYWVMIHLLYPQPLFILMDNNMIIYLNPLLNRFNFCLLCLNLMLNCHM